VPWSRLILAPVKSSQWSAAPPPTLTILPFAFPQKEWKQLNEDPLKPLLNRAIQAQLAPGSVFKIITATAMLEDHSIPESFTTYCPGYGTFYGRQFKCWVYSSKKGPTSHGSTDLHDAILKSCDVFFYTVA
jgi:penicillin-binding protein 2